METKPVKLVITIVIILMLSIEYFGCTSRTDMTAGQKPRQEKVMENKYKALVIYYSRTGNTAVVAETLKESLACDLQEIKDLKDRSGILGFIGGMIDVKKNPITMIAPKTVDLKGYDLIFICSPIWGMKFAPAITTLMDSAEFNNKKVVFVAVATGRMKPSTFDECGRLVQSKGGEAIGTMFLKTMFKKPEKIREEAKKIIAENMGRWMK